MEDLNDPQSQQKYDQYDPPCECCDLSSRRPRAEILDIELIFILFASSRSKGGGCDASRAPLKGGIQGRKTSRLA